MRYRRIGGIAIIFGFMLASCKTQPASTGIPSLSLYSTRVVATVASQAIHQATLAVLPGTTPTGTPNTAAQLCDTANLTATEETDGATGAITFTVLVTNQGPRVCKLQGQPQVQIVNQQAEPLVLQDAPFCFECSPSKNPVETFSPATQTAQPPAATATAQAVLRKPLSLAVGASARLFLIWRNWCPPFPEGGVSLLLTLPGGSGKLTIPTDARTGGRCDVPDAGSSLSVSQFMP